jgi:hypothetical protein
MGSRIPGGVVGVTAISLFLGGYLIYSGANTAMSGMELASTGGEFGVELATLGGFWRVFGILYLFLGVLCIIVSFGIISLKEWGRRNGVFIHSIIAALSIIMGMIVGFFDPIVSLPSFAVLAVSGVCAIYLRKSSVKSFYEFQGYERPDIPARHVEVYSPTVIVREGALERESKPSNILRCGQCDTVNMNVQFCKKCGTELLK